MQDGSAKKTRHQKTVGGKVFALDYGRLMGGPFDSSRLNGTDPVTGVSSINDEQSEVLNALRVKKPDVSQQLTLL